MSEDVPLVDAHCHIYTGEYEDIEGMQREASKRMKVVVVSGAHVEWNYKAKELAHKYDNFYYSVGIHPVDASKLSNEEFSKALEDMEKMIKEDKGKKVVGIGEIGLDYHWVKDERKQEVMKERFIQQIELANKHKMPIVIHSWAAEEDAIKIIEKHYEGEKVLMHSLTNHKVIEQVKENNFFVSIPTSIGRSKSVKKIAKRMPLEKIVTETDSPWLSPYGEKVNYPWNVLFTLEKISEMRKIKIRDLAEEILRNVGEVYGV